MRSISASFALPVSVFSAAVASNAVAFSDWDVPDVSAYMEIVDDEDLEETVEIRALASLQHARYWEEVTELIEQADDAILVA